MHLYKENIWSNPHASSIHPVIQTSTIILWTELFIKKRREKIRGENFNLHSSSNPRVSSNSTRNPFYLQELQCFPHAIQQLQVILHTELILLQEILQLQGSSCADHYKASSSDCSCASKHSTWQN